MRHCPWPLVVVALWPACGCAPPAAPAPDGPAATADSPRRPPAKLELPGLHNVYRLTPGLYSGGGPEGDEGFRSLQRLGVKTVVSVDGARPDVARARRHGLRYVHLPVGYDGIPGPQVLRLARAARDLPGPVYVHCHHGKHRGPAAAAVIHLCLDDRCSVETALEELRRAVTDPRYSGLYAAVRQLRRPTKAELDGVPADFPSVAEVAALAQVMVQVDERWGHLQQVRAAGWKVLPDHPDVDPPHEALQLAQQFREAARLPQVKARPAEFRRWLAEAEAGLSAFEGVLRQVKGAGTVDAVAAEAAFRRASADCVRCHGKYRDVAQVP
jgi:protein tyrosine phosphatase (PTP) superfamily phosphohydrolase (DUF442 family)